MTESRGYMAGRGVPNKVLARLTWFPNIAGVLLDENADWDEIDSLLRANCRVLAPKKLGASIE